MTDINRRIVLQSRPEGVPQTTDFKLESHSVPQPAAGQVLLRTLYLSLDPYMRGRMSTADSYAPSVDLGEVMVGGTVSRVVESQHADFARGDLVVGAGGWQEYALSDGQDLNQLDPAMAQPSLALSSLGMPGFTAYHGLLNIGEPQPGETVVVASAAGTVGAIVGQLARLKGAKAIGVAGGEDKCRYAVDTLGFDACIDRHDADFATQLAAATPAGIDVYYENVGGAVLDAVLARLNVGARVPVCGLIAHYNDTELPEGPDRLSYLMRRILVQRLKVQGFIIADHFDSPAFPEFVNDMSDWVAGGQIGVNETIVDGLEQAPQAFIDLLAGQYLGKVVIQVAAE